MRYAASERSGRRVFDALLLKFIGEGRKVSTENWITPLGQKVATVLRNDYFAITYTEDISRIIVFKLVCFS